VSSGPLALGIDSSTQGISAVAVELGDFSVAAEASLRYRDAGRLAAFGLPAEGAPILPPRAPGEADQPAALYLASLELLLAELGPELLGRVAAIDFSAQQHGQVWVGAGGLAAMAALREPGSGRPGASDLVSRIAPGLASERAPIWMSSDAAPEAAAMRAELGGPERAAAVSGSDFPARFSGPVLARRGARYPEEYGRCERVHLISSFLAGVLAGEPEAPIDWGNGSGTGWMDWAGRRWSPELLAAGSRGLAGGAAGLARRLPPLAHPLELAGRIAPYFVERFGFDPACAVAAGSGDNPQSKVLAEGALLSLGTSFVLMSPGERPHPSANAMYDGLGRPFLFGCRTNGALAWEAIRLEAGLGLEDFAASELALSRRAPFSGLRVYQPLAESFPPSPELDTGRLGSFEADYAAVVDSSLGLLALGAGAFAARAPEVAVTGGAAASPGVLGRVAAIWGLPARPLGAGGAAAGAALSAACALARAAGAGEAELAALAGRARASLGGGGAAVEPPAASGGREAFLGRLAASLGA